LHSLEKSSKPVNLYGHLRKNEKLCYVLAAGVMNHDLPCIGKLYSDNLPAEGYFCGLLKDDEITFHVNIKKQWHKADVVIVDDNDIYKRTPFSSNLLDVLGKTRVVFFGVGSVGSRIALGLARSGIKNFRLIDPDIFSVENVARHVCDMTDVGRYKVTAVRERILRINPQAQVEIFPYDILSQRDKTKNNAFSDVHLIIASTDRKSVQLRINNECYHRSIPGLFVGCYDEARAGEVLFILPGITKVCYECLRGGTRQQEKSRQYDYSTAKSHEDYEGEPGLNAAINQVSDIAEQHAIALLLRNEQCEMSRLIKPHNNLLFISSGLGEGFYYLRDAYCFTKSFEVIQPIMKEPWTNCSTCQKSL
jgi:molybdopterin/thiamine biosynthesis adenylyltransferase